MSLFKVLTLMVFLMSSSNCYSQRNDYDPQTDQLGKHLTNDIVAAGFSIGATLSGSVPLALTAGFLTKYIVTYGVAGVKAVINRIKGHRLEDLGQINLYMIYLVHTKRNLYKSIIEIRKSVEKKTKTPFYLSELKKIEDLVSDKCKKDCLEFNLDEKILDNSLLEISLDVDKNLEIESFVSLDQLKTHYFYLNNLFLDIMMVEQKLARSQVQVLSNQIKEIKKQLEENEYISNVEKEYRFQKAMNIALRWKRNMAKKSINISNLLAAKTKRLIDQNTELNSKIGRNE